MSDVPEGYKMTEVGVIPVDWGVKTIKELIDNKDILDHLDGNHGELYPRSGEFKESGVPYVGANDFSEGHINFQKCKYLSEEKAKQFRKGVAKNGDVLFAHNATVGPVALLKIKFDFVILSTTATYFRCNDEKFCNIYLQYALQAPYFVKQYRAVMAQSTRYQVPITAQRKFSLVIPPLPEQQAIASTLSDIDALISALEQLITKKRNIKQGAMQQLLTGEKRLPGFSGEWNVKKLGEILQSFKLGGNYPNSEKETNCPLIKMGNVNRGFIDLSKIEFITIGYIPSKNDKLHYGDILFNTRNTLELVGKVSIWKNELHLAYYNSNLMRLEFKTSEVSSNFFMNYILNTKQSLSQLKGFATGTTSVAAIYTRDLLKLEITLPALSEQQAIAQILSDMDTEIEALEQKQAKYKAIKHGMMQELLTGKTRLV